MEEYRPKFIADENVGKLARWLRLLGFDTRFFKGENDGEMVEIALAENRVILSRDTHMMERKLIAGGQVKALLLKTDNVFQQTQIALTKFELKPLMRLFTLCLECNLALVPLNREAVKERVPPYVWQTQSEYVECPGCRRVYWKGTHWSAMRQEMAKLNIMNIE